MSDKNELRKGILNIVQGAVMEHVISSHDLMGLCLGGNGIKERFRPEYVRAEMENWYKNLGIERLLCREFQLSLPYWTEEEIKDAYDNGEMLVCVPKGIGRVQLGKLFHLESWALSDDLITNTVEAEDLWFKTKVDEKPERCDTPGKELATLYIQEERLGMSLERYMAFIARMFHVYHRLPDTEYKTWLLHGKYEKKAMLIAGFDSEGKFSVHSWLPHFHSPKVGGRYAVIPDHHYI